MKDLRVTVVGLGLMGGSLALALRPHVAHLMAVDVDAETRQQALAGDVVDEAVSSLAEGVREASAVILATPVHTILEHVADLSRLRPDGCFVLDLGSTKAQICDALSALPSAFEAVGGHPMCGKETAGLGAAEADLYRDQTFVLCRTARTTPAGEALAVALVKAIGARPRFLAPDEHDEVVALVSHLPYFVAATLMEQAAAAARENEHVWPVSASGFRDTSRLSGTSAGMLRDVVLTNRPAIVAQLRRYRDHLEDLVSLLAAGDESEIEAWLAARQREYGVYRREK
ncbi:MAG: prephenate dehydrogenase [Candidatus Promineifilaceae bacterium]|nr:prephenate dehydrogenase [Candidatus Promineifilaceae bacterium]